MSEFPPPATPPLLHRLIAAGALRYWIIGSWALALATCAPFAVVVIWFATTTALGIVRGMVDRRLQGVPGRRAAAGRLGVATTSCVAWAAAPLTAVEMGGEHGVIVAMALLIAGYVLVFTQMRAAPHEALIVSSPYTAVLAVMFWEMWGGPLFWPVSSLVPVVGLALLIKVIVTQMKDAQLEAVNAEQARLIERLGQERDRADAANAAKSNFLGVISHELRTPMNGVLGAAELLSMSGPTERQAEMVGVIRTSGQSLMMLLNDILDITKIEAGKMDLALADVPTDGLLTRLTGPFAAQAEAKGVGFEARMTGDWPAALRMDALRLGQIAHNLLGNAVKFTQAGTVRLDVDGRTLDDGRCAVTVAVSDTGIGIAPEDVALLFQPFSQVDDSSTRRFGGTGLGLSICQRLAGMMGGEIRVESVPGQGSTFTLRATFDEAVPQTEAARAA